MGSMRRALVHTAGWLAATTAAVAVSWHGVHTMLSGTAYDPPQALPISVQNSGSPLPPTAMGPTPAASASVPSESPSPEEDDKTPSTPPTPSRATSSPKQPQQGDPPVEQQVPPPPAPEPNQEYTGQVQSKAVEGGQVAFEMGPDWAKLVSATPESGWAMTVWEQPTWIRVDFVKDNITWSVFCVWNEQPPQIDTWKDVR